MARKSGPTSKAPRRSKPASKSSKLTAAELAATLQGESTLPPEKVEQAIAGVQVDVATVERAFVERITPDGQHHGSPLALRVHDAADNEAVKPATLAPVATDNHDSPQKRGCNLLAQVFGYWKQRCFTVRDFLDTCPAREVELPTLEMSAVSWHELADHFTDSVVMTAVNSAHHVDEPNPFRVPTDWAGVVTRTQEKPDRYWPAIAKSLSSFKLTEFEADKLERFVDLEWDAMNAAGSGQDAVRSLIRDGCRHAIYLLLAAQATEDARLLKTVGQVGLKGERFRRLHDRFLDGSERFPHLRYIAATGCKTCPEWPRVPHHSLQAGTIGLNNAHWLDVTNKRPGTFFVGRNDHWLEIEGQLWHGAFYFDGPVASLNDHDGLQRQNAEIRGAIEQFELLANQAAGFLGNLPSVHPGVDHPRKPELWHRWLEAVCASAPVEPAGYHCFDVRRVPGNIFQASAILLEHLHTAADKPDATTRPLAPLNVNECDLRPVLAAAEAFLAERRKADERGKFDEGGALHILGIARRHLAEALAPFNHPDGLTGDDATVGAVKALLTMANDGRADCRVERVEAVVAFLRKAAGHTEGIEPIPESSALPAEQQEPPLPPSGYLGLRVDDDRRMISREGFTAVVNLQDSRIKWAIFKKLAGNRDVPVAPEAIISLWDAHGVARKPSDGTVNDAVSELRASLKTIGLTIMVKRKVGRLLAELPPPADKTKPRRRKKKK